VLVDCNLPGTDGTALARRLIEEGGAAVRVIGVSADADDAARAVAAGMSAMLQKPVSAAQLQHAIAAAMAVDRETSSTRNL
jgi:CheY-like chemotaxis protein